MIIKDWNDLHQVHGLEVVKMTIDAALQRFGFGGLHCESFEVWIVIAAQALREADVVPAVWPVSCGTTLKPAPMSSGEVSVA